MFQSRSLQSESKLDFTLLLSIFLFLVVGYLIGGFPSAVLVVKLKGKNVFEVGSSNMGAMNVARNLGYGLGVLVLLLDIGKGALATYLGLLFSQEAAVSASLAVIIGHLWSPYIGFKGGKALSTTFGASVVLYPIAALILLVILVIATLLAKGSTTGVFLTLFLYPIGVFLASKSIEATFVALLISFFITFKYLIAKD